jgi:hypothetical protein
MRQHDNQWPLSWDDLLTVIDVQSDEPVMFRGAAAGNLSYARSLHEKVAIDWTFDPQQPGAANPVTRVDGRPFVITWQGAEPNEMVRTYLSGRAGQRRQETGVVW